MAVGSSDADFAIARYTADGNLDPTFGNGGKVETNFGSVDEGGFVRDSEDDARAVAIQRNGKIVVAGASDVSGRYGEKFCCVRDFALVRYNPDGSLDQSFGTGGKLLTAFELDSLYVNSYAEDVGIDPNGRIVAAGGGGSFFELARYNPRGELDGSFGNGGKVTTP